MRKIRLILFSLSLIFTARVVKAQLAGTYSVPATYSTIAAAIQDLNTQGVNGPVTILIDAGYTETAPVGGLSLTATGTATNTITFQKNGSGSNPQIVAYAGGTATPASAIQDGIWKFIGSDYITIDGIDVFDNNASNPSTMEYGYGFFKASAADGCQNNTIKNCLITLNKINNAIGSGPSVDGSRGIDVVNALFNTHTTAVTTTVAAGANSNNKFYNNAITNCNIGIAIIGFAATTPFTNADTGNDIGGLSAATGNTITNFGGGGTTAAAAGIRTLAQYGINVSYNLINSNTGTGTNHVQILRGILLGAATSANASILGNTITISGGGTTQQNTAIENASGSTAAANTINISNNLITNCKYTTATTGVFYGIYNNGASAAMLSINNNTLTGNSTNATSGSYYNIYNTGSVTQSISIQNNVLSNITFSATSTSLSNYNIYSSTAGASSTINISGNSVTNYSYTGTTGGTGAWAGVYALTTGSVLSVQNNTLTNLTLKTTGTIYMFYNSNYSYTTNISGNSVNSFSRTGTTGALYGIYNGYFSTLGNVANIYNNNINNVSNGLSTGAVYMTYWTVHQTLNLYNNTISNISAPSGTSTFYGLYPYYYSTTTNIYDNTISNITYGTGTIYGIYYYEYYATAANVYNNYIYNLQNGGSTNVGLYIYYTGNAGGGNYNFHRNRITDISSSNVSAAGVTGIDVYSFYGGNVNVYNNLVGNLGAPASSNGSAVKGINVSSPSTGLNLRLSYNSVNLTGSSSGTGFGSAALYYGNSNPALTLRNNIFVNNSVPTGAGIASAFYASSVPMTNLSSSSNNNLYYAGTPGTSNLIFNGAGTPYQTLVSYQTLVAPAENISVTENPPFTSIVGTNSNFLNISTVTPTQIEGWAVPVAGITTDYTTTVRNAATPDIGAWEGNFVSSIPVCSGAPAANTAVTSNSFACANSSFNLSMVNSYTNSGYTYQWQASTTGSVGPYTNISGAVAAAFTNTGITVPTWFQCVITCTAGPSTTTSSAVEVQVNTNLCQCATYCPSQATSTGDEEIFNVTFGTLNNTSSCATTGGAGSILNQYSNYTGIVAAPSIAAGSTYAFSVTVGECSGSSYSGGAVAYIDYNQNGLFTDPGEQIYVSPSTAFAVAGTTLGANVTVPLTASIGVTRMRVIAVENSVGQAPCTNYTWGETEDYCITILAPTICTATPASNTAVASVTTVCPGGTATLSLANSYTTTGLSYQWSIATSSVGTYTAIPSGTLASLTATNITNTYWYQCVITCTSGPSSTTSTPVQLQVNYSPCSCLAYCTSSATSTADDEIFNVSIGTLNNTSSCSQTGGPGSVQNQYSNYTGIVAAPALVAGSVYQFSTTVGQCGAGAYSGGVVVYMDFNQNGLFTDPGEQVYTSASTLFAITGTTLTAPITIPVTASVGITRMRVIAVESSVGQAPCTNYTWGETEDYCIDIQAPVGCTGAPAANSAVATVTSVCPNGSVTVNLATTYTVGGLNYQWSVSTSSVGTYTAVAGGTLSSLTATNITTSLWYQCVITCTNGPASTTATPIEVIVNNNPCQCASYCNTSLASSTADDEIFNVTLGTLNNTSNCSQTGGPGSILNRYSIYAGLVAAPSLSTGSTYAFSVTVGQCGAGAYSGGVVIYMDFNQNGLFTDAGELVFVSPSTLFAIAGTTLSGNIMIPPTASIGTTRMRVIAVESTTNAASCAGYTWGETEDYCIDIVPAPPCTTAVAGTVTPSTFGACTGASVTLNSTGYSLGSGTAYQWMVSPTPGGPYTNVTSGTGSTSVSYTTSALTPTVYYYVLQVACPTMSLVNVSNEATVTINSVPTASINSNAPICANNNLNLIGGTDIGTTFNWYGPNSFTSSVQNPTITNAPGAANGNYTLVVSISGCSATPVVSNITVNSTSLSILASPPAICLGNSTTLTAVGNATTLTWNTGATTTSIVVSPTVNTTYSVSGVGASNCPQDFSVTIAVANPTINGTGASVCSPTTVATLSATAFGPINWYASASSTTSIGTGNTFTASAASTTTYYAQANSVANATLFTTLAAGNGSSGNMFDVVALNNIEVNGFDMHFSSVGTATMEVWYRPGTFVGFESSSTGWTMAYTTTVNALGTGVLSIVPGSFSVNVPAGQTYGFYVTAISPGPQVNYTNGTLLGNIYSQNSDVQILEGKGGTYFNVINNPRVFNGQMRYTKVGCTSPIIPVVLTVGAQPTVSAVASSGTVCAGGSTGLTASGATTYSWSTGSTNTIIPVTPSVTTTYSVVGDYGSACNDTAFVTVVVNSLPTVSLSSAQTSVCVNGPTVSLSGTPVGGAYTGSNVSTGAFTPGSTPGTYTPSYAYTDPTTGCSNSATTAITVSSLPSVSLTATQYTTCINSGTISLSGSPAGGVYAGSNASSSGVFTPGASQGTFASTYSYTNSTTGCSNTATTSIVVSICTGLENQLNALSNLMVYPNPNYGEFTIELSNGLDKKVEITDLTGRVILTSSTADDKLKLNISNLANGVYFVKIQSNKAVEVVKIVKQ